MNAAESARSAVWKQAKVVATLRNSSPATAAHELVGAANTGSFGSCGKSNR